MSARYIIPGCSHSEVRSHKRAKSGSWHIADTSESLSLLDNITGFHMPMLCQPEGYLARVKIRQALGLTAIKIGEGSQICKTEGAMALENKSK